MFTDISLTTYQVTSLSISRCRSLLVGWWQKQKHFKVSINKKVGTKILVLFRDLKNVNVTYCEIEYRFPAISTSRTTTITNTSLSTSSGSRLPDLTDDRNDPLGALALLKRSAVIIPPFKTALKEKVEIKSPLRKQLLLSKSL